MQRLMGQIDQVRRDVGQIRQQQRDEPVIVPLKSEPNRPRRSSRTRVKPLSYNDVEILRALPTAISCSAIWCRSVKRPVCRANWSASG